MADLLSEITVCPTESVVVTTPEMGVEENGCESVGWKVTTVPSGRVTKLAVLRLLEIVTAPDTSLTTVWPRELVVVTIADPALPLR